MSEPVLDLDGKPINIGKIAASLRGNDAVPGVEVHSVAMEQKPHEEPSDGWEWKCSICTVTFSSRRLMTEAQAQEHFRELVVSHKRSGCRPRLPAKEKKA